LLPTLQASACRVWRFCRTLHLILILILIIILPKMTKSIAEMNSPLARRARINQRAGRSCGIEQWRLPLRNGKRCAQAGDFFLAWKGSDPRRRIARQKCGTRRLTGGHRISRQKFCHRFRLRPPSSVLNLLPRSLKRHVQEKVGGKVQDNAQRNTAASSAAKCSVPVSVHGITGSVPQFATPVNTPASIVKRPRLSFV
jgi:hypothetical protein